MSHLYVHLQPAFVFSPNTYLNGTNVLTMCMYIIWNLIKNDCGYWSVDVTRFFNCYSTDIDYAIGYFTWRQAVPAILDCAYILYTYVCTCKQCCKAGLYVWYRTALYLPTSGWTHTHTQTHTYRFPGQKQLIIRNQTCACQKPVKIKVLQFII